MPPAIAPPKNRPRNADASENTAAPHLTPQEEQVEKEENQPDSFQEAMTPNPERAIPMTGNPNPFPTMVGNQEEFVPMKGNPNSFPIMAGNPGEFIPMIPYPAAPITMEPSQDEAQETEQEPNRKSIKTKQKNGKQEPPTTFQGFPVISQIVELITDGPEGADSGFYTTETWFKIKPGLGGRVKQLINPMGEVVKVIESGIFKIKKQPDIESSTTLPPTVLPEFVVEGTFKPLDIKPVFTEKGTDFTVRKLDMSEGGNIVATRLSKSGRKMMQIAALAANASGIGAIIGLGTEVAVTSTQENPSTPSMGSKLSAASTIIDLANKGAEVINPVDDQTKRFTGRFLSVFGKAANLFQLAEILSSDATRRELATQILFDQLSRPKGGKNIGAFRIPGREDQLEFNDKFSKRGIKEITEILNLNTALIEERLMEVKQEIERRSSNQR